MRHRKKFNHLGRKAPHRRAMLANMASSLIIHKRITTTTAKAKALRSFVEPVITGSKEDSTHSRRLAFKQLRDKHAVSELFREVAAKVGDRPGGYTRIIKLGSRPGDNADMCIIELVDYNENLLAERAAAKPKATRRRRGGKKKAERAETAVTAGAADAGEEIPADGDTAELSTAEPESAAGELKDDTAKEENPEPEAGGKDESASEEDTEEGDKEKNQEKKEE